jgi:serine/threonine protein kinase
VERSNQFPKGEAGRETVPLPVGEESEASLATTSLGADSAEDVGPHATIGRYLLEDELARGGMGVVFRARHPELDRTVALKVLLAGQLSSPEQRERFRLEAKAAARLRHPHVVAIHDVGEDEGRPFLVMDLVDGDSLGSRLDRDGPLPTREAATLIQKIAGALHFAHGHSVLHRDVKPDNILLSPEGEPLLTDFGLAKLLDSQVTGPTLSGQFLGTPAFMSPEQVRSTAVDPRTDVYGLGATLYALLTGSPPFDAEQILELVTKVLQDEPPPPSQLESSVPSALDTICLTCLEKNPAYRYPTAQAMADDLGRFLNGQSITAKPPGVIRREWEALTENRKTSPVTNLALLLFVVVFAWVAWRVNDWNTYHALVLQLDSRSSNTRAAAAKTLRNHAGEGTASVLLNAARNDDSPGVRIAALQSLDRVLNEAQPMPQMVLRSLLPSLERPDAGPGERDLAWKLAQRVARQLGAPQGDDLQAFKDWLHPR